MRTTREFLDGWLTAGRLTAAQFDAWDAVDSRRRISLFAELNVLLYLGVLAFAGGLAWTGRAYSDRWGDLAILLPATALALGCLAWVVAKAPAYSSDRVLSPSLGFDYVLYLACLVVGVELGYAQYRFPGLQAQWDWLLLASAAAGFAAAYRFDNRFVLSLALATLGGWFGVRMARFAWVDAGSARVMSVGYAVVVAALGATTWHLRLKRHFLDTYLQVAALVGLSALTWGVMEHAVSPWLVAALVAAAGVVAGGIRARHFSFVVYGAIAGYIAVSRVLLPHSPGIEASFL